MRLGCAAFAVSLCGSVAADAVEASETPGVEDHAASWFPTPTLGGRLQLDGNWIDEDEDAPFGSGVAPEKSGTDFRSAMLSVTGKIFTWRYRIQPEIVRRDDTGKTEVRFEDAYLAAPFWLGEIAIGQRRPFRSMEDLTNSNEILMIERPFASSAGIFAGGQSREYGIGLFHRGTYDLFTWGGGVYSLRGINVPGSEGVGVSARLTYAPNVDPGQVFHVGASVSHERPQSAQAVMPLGIGTAVSYAGYRGPRVTIGSTANGEPATTFALEYANSFAWFFSQAEVMYQHLEQGDDVDAQRVLAYYVQGSVFLTGETKPYNQKEGVFRSPKANSRLGALELAARFDSISNLDAEAFGGCEGSGFPDRCDARAVTLGLNYYLNPYFRFMLNYVFGEQDRGAAGKDRPRTLAARFQMSF